MKDEHASTLQAIRLPEHINPWGRQSGASPWRMTRPRTLVHTAIALADAAGLGRLDQRPIEEIVGFRPDRTFGGTIRSYLYPYEYARGRFVRIHVSILSGDPREPTIVALPGLTTDAVGMWCICAQRVQDAGYGGTILFVDLPGVGFSDTPQDPAAYTAKVAFESTMAAIQAAGRHLGHKNVLRSFLFWIQSLGYIVPMYGWATRQIPRTVTLAYGTSPNQIGLTLGGPPNRALDLLAGLSLAEWFFGLRPLVSKEDFVRLLHWFMRDGVPSDFAIGWGHGFNQTCSPVTGEPVDYASAALLILREMVAKDYIRLGRDILPRLRSGDHHLALYVGERDPVTTPRAVRAHAAALRRSPAFRCVRCEVIPGMTHFQVGWREQGRLAAATLDWALPTAARVFAR